MLHVKIILSVFTCLKNQLFINVKHFFNIYKPNKGHSIKRIYTALDLLIVSNTFLSNRFSLIPQLNCIVLLTYRRRIVEHDFVIHVGQKRVTFFPNTFFQKFLFEFGSVVLYNPLKNKRELRSKYNKKKSRQCLN